jgi:hypothetical protein
MWKIAMPVDTSMPGALEDRHVSGHKVGCEIPNMRSKRVWMTTLQMILLAPLATFITFQHAHESAGGLAHQATLHDLDTPHWTALLSRPPVG